MIAISAAFGAAVLAFLSLVVLINTTHFLCTRNTNSSGEAMWECPEGKEYFVLGLAIAAGAGCFCDDSPRLRPCGCCGDGGVGGRPAPPAPRRASTRPSGRVDAGEAARVEDVELAGFVLAEGGDAVAFHAQPLD